MRAVMRAIEDRTGVYRRHPLFEFLRNEAIEPEKRLAFAPSAAHYILTFTDFCQHVLRSEPAQDRLQELVNAQTYEEATHSRWFLQDLARLGHDPLVRFSDALRFIWSEETVRSRMLSYQLCRLALGADSLHKLTLVHCVEATAEVTISHVMRVGEQWSAKHGKGLEFFGKSHEDAEEHHGIWGQEAQAIIDDIRLQPETRQALEGLVDQAFQHFTAFADELLAVSLAERGDPRATG
jgi:hypothetical protein